MGWVIRILVLLLVVRLLWRLVQGILQGMSEPRAVPPRRTTPLVRDPVCGTYVLPSRALAVKSGGTTEYFCSDECRRKYQES